MVKGADKIYIGDFIMNIEEGSGPSTSSTSGSGQARPSATAAAAPGARPALPPCRRFAPKRRRWMAAGMEDELDEQPEESAGSPVSCRRGSCEPTDPPPGPAGHLRHRPLGAAPPAPPPPLRSLPKPPLPTPSTDGGGLDNRSSRRTASLNKATMMAGDAPRVPSPPPAPILCGAHPATDAAGPDADQPAG